jgi:F-type H+-transporting ATPase subunit b
MLSLPFADIVENLKNAGELTGWNSQQFLTQCFVVTVLFVVLYLFAWKPVRTILEDRRSTIEESMKNADRIKKELADAEASKLEVLKKANEQANALITEAEKAAAIRGEQKTQEAVRQAEEIIKKAHEASVLERESRRQGFDFRRPDPPELGNHPPDQRQQQLTATP